MRRWLHADKYQPQLDDLGPGRMLILGHGGVSPFTFDGLDRHGRWQSVWILDHERVKAEVADGPKSYNVRSWQLDGRSPDLMDKSLRTGLSQ